MDADRVSLLECVNLAATRGPHSHGYAIPEEGTWRSHRGPGAATEAIDLISDECARGVRAIIGHSRLATTGVYAGGAPRIEDTMPFTVEGVTIVHNGNIRRHAQIARTFGFDLTTGCDSEVIAHLIANDRKHEPDGPLTAAVSRVIEIFDDGRPFALIAISSNGHIAAAHRDLPLFVANADEGTYFCSRRPAIANATIALSPPVWGWPLASHMADAI